MACLPSDPSMVTGCFPFAYIKAGYAFLLLFLRGTVIFKGLHHPSPTLIKASLSGICIGFFFLHIFEFSSIKKNARGVPLHLRFSLGRCLVHVFILVSVKREVADCWFIVMVFNICNAKA